jgi:xanthine dehydrogenase accessory factor
MTSAAEISAILRLARTCESEGVRAALARLVSVEGSHYRKPGARMLLAEDGRTVGTISAGCLEADLRRRLPDVFASGRTESIDYDSRTFEDLVWGLGSGCNGFVRVLLSPFAGPLREIHEQISGILAGGATVHLATAVAPPSGSDLRTGDVRMVVGEETLPREEPSGIFREEILPAITLLIAGAGPDAVPLARMAAGLGWNVHVLSPRDPSFVLERFRGVEVGLVGSVEEARTLPAHSRSATVVMSHDFATDASVLEALLPRGFPYLGVLGPRERTARLLRACGAPREAAARIHSPAGLDLGAETAEEIALSIVAEIQAVLGASSPTRALPAR